MFPMKPVLILLLVASLAANVALGLRPRSSGPAAAAGSSPSASSLPPGPSAGKPPPGSTGGTASRANPASPASAGTDQDTAAANAAIDWQPHGSEQELHRLVAGLRAAGYPAAVVRAVVNQLLNERFAARQPSAAQPYWKQMTPTPETRAAQRALGEERQALLESLLGADARPSATMDAAARSRRYGQLSDDKIDAIARIERDYNEMTSDAYARQRSNTAADANTMMQTQQLMEKEKLADLAAVLTPEELAEYEMRNSASARTVMRSLRNVEVNESEYAALYEMQKAHDAANPRRVATDMNTFAQRQAAQAALYDQVRTVLGEDRFYAYLEGADSNYANVARALTAFPAVTPAVSYQVYQLQTELQRAMSQLSRNGPPSADRIAELRATAETYNSRLEALIGAEAAAAYRQQGMGRMFAPVRPAPGTGTTTGSQPGGR